MCSRFMSRLLCGPLCSNPLGHEGLNGIAYLDVIEVGNAHAALHAVSHFAGIVLEALERRELALEDLLSIPHEANFRIALDGAVDHAATGNRAHLGDPEDVEHLGPADIVLLDGRLEQAQHGLLD